MKIILQDRLTSSFDNLVSVSISTNLKHKGAFLTHFLLPNPKLTLEHLPATARSNNICTVICVQDFEQLKGLYGASSASVIRNNLWNQFFGMTGNLHTGEYVSKLVGEYTHVKTSLRLSDGFFEETASRTTTLGKEKYLPPSLLSRQSPGEFVVKVAGADPKFLSTYLKPVRYAKKLSGLPAYHTGDLGMKIEANWVKIHQEVDELFGVYGILL